MNRFIIVDNNENLQNEIDTIFSLTSLDFTKTTLIVLGKEKKLSCNANNIIFIENADNNYDNLLDYLEIIITSSDYVFMPYCDKLNKLANLLSIKLNARCLLNALKLENKDNKLIATKNIYSNYLLAEYDITGGIVCTIKLNNKVNKCTEKVQNQPNIILKVLKSTDKVSFKVIKREIKEQSNLTTATKVLLIGKGVKKDKVADCLKLARLLNAEVGATRPVTHDGVIPIDRMVGSSNISVSPDILITLGVSGSAPLVSGIKNSKKIISVNKDSNAMIFNHSHIGIVEDTTTFIDEMISKLGGKND